MGGEAGTMAGSGGEQPGGNGGVGGENAGAGGSEAGNGGAGGSTATMAERLHDLAVDFCNKPIPNAPNPDGCTPVDTCIGYMEVNPFYPTVDCDTKWEALMKCRNDQPASAFACSSAANVIDSYAVDSGVCVVEFTAAAYCSGT